MMAQTCDNCTKSRICVVKQELNTFMVRYVWQFNDMEAHTQKGMWFEFLAGQCGEYDNGETGTIREDNRE